jgi:hypothetical protein
MESLHGKRIQKMINWLVNRIFRWDPLRKAVFDEVRLYQSVDRSMWEHEKNGPSNLTWSEGDRWYGWTYNSNAKRYYFDDIGNESLMGLWEDQWAREADENPVEKINKWSVEQIQRAKYTGEVPF